MVPFQPQQIVAMDSEEIRDSLSFATRTRLPHVPSIGDAIILQATNDILKSQLEELNKQYYQWKVACIMIVVRAHQLFNEYKKIDNKYMHHN